MKRVLVKTLGYPLVHTSLLGTMTSVKTGAPAVALTFDDGPDPVWTPRLLDLLKQYSARATFFTVGENAERFPELIARIAEEGHALGNHTFSHCSLPLLPWKEQRMEIRRCSDLLGPQAAGLFRPPYGHQTLKSRLAARCEKQRVVVWSAEIGDWRKQDVQTLRHALRESLAPGAVILLHDSIHLSADVTPGPDLQPDRGRVFEALKSVLKETAGTFQYLTLPELMQAGSPQWSSWFRFSRNVA